MQIGEADMKVAFSSSTGANVDENFRTANSFSVWDIRPRESYYITTRFVRIHGGSKDDRIAKRADAVSDCAIVCARQIGGPAAAKLVVRNIHPMKTNSAIPVEKVIERLQEVLSGAPAPWLRKAQAKEPDVPPVWNHAPLLDSVLDATLADIMSRYPEAADLLLGTGLALFPDEESLHTIGGLLSVKEALALRGICPDLFQLLLEEVVRKKSLRRMV